LSEKLLSKFAALVVELVEVVFSNSIMQK